MDPADTPNLNYLWCGLLVEELVRQGVAGFVISPGSRSAPLTVSVARNERARYWVHYDERGAAFFALGLARATRQPAVLICTSGSAAANYWPAVVEAAADRVPLIILTADRPPELVDCGANQAIDQTHLYGNYARWYAALPCPEAVIDPSYVLTTADQAWFRSQRPVAGPVHVNVPLREPLDPASDGSEAELGFHSLLDWLDGEAPFSRYEMGHTTMTDATEARLLTLFQTERDGLLVVGRLDHPRDTAAVRDLARALGWPVLADATAGLRGPEGADDLEAAGRELLFDQLETGAAPHCVLHLGAGFVSKPLLSFLRETRPQYIHVCDTPHRLDPNHQVTEHISMEVAAFCRWLGSAVSANKPVAQTPPPRPPLPEGPLTEAGAVHHLGELVPENSLLFAGNSMPVRFVDSAFYPAAAGVQIAANRGASGIDGNIATALGMATARNTTTTILVGDLTALHDLNSLALLRNVMAPVILVVLNNDGGGIFHKLPIARAEEPCFERCFGTPHGLDFAGAARMFGLAHNSPTTHAEFAKAYTDALGRNSATLLEVRINRYETDNVLRGKTGIDLTAAMKTEERLGQSPDVGFWFAREKDYNDPQETGEVYSTPDAMRPVTLAGTEGMPPLLLLHGFMGTRDDWMPLAETLGDAFHVLGANLPGHGPGWDGFPVEHYGMAEIAEGLHQHLAALNITSCGLLGYSMGGRVALYLAALFPERYPRVVLESASPGLDSAEKRESRRISDLALAERLRALKPQSPKFRSFLEEWYAMPLSEHLKNDPERLEGLIERRLAANDPAQLACSLVGLGTGSQPNLWPYLEHYRPRTLLAVGANDRKFRIIAEEMCERCPAMAVMEFAGCGHNVHLEQPAEFARAARNFLAMT